jgi:hypothetical protein
MNDRAIPTEINTNETLGIFGDETFFSSKNKKSRLIKKFDSRKFLQILY